MSSRRRAARTVLLTLAAVVLAGAVSAIPARATGWGGTDPRYNIAPVPAIAGSVCDSSPYSAACRARIIQALDHARAAQRHSAYALPSRFGWLSPREKLLVLISQDRQALGLTRVYGMNAPLNANAAAAIPHRADPSPVTSLGGRHWLIWAANWAGGNGAYASPLSAYYDWMYYDGLNPNGTSWNILCSRATPGYCWKHRHNILLRPGAGQQLAVGLAVGPDGRGWEGSTQLFETVPASASVSYVPTVVMASTRTAHHTGGGVLTISGFGFVKVRSVHVLGANASVLASTPWTVRVRLPAHAPGYGHIVVTAVGGTSSLNYAAGFRYVP